MRMNMIIFYCDIYFYLKVFSLLYLDVLCSEIGVISVCYLCVV